MECAYYDAGRCRSCSLLPVPYPRQVSDKQNRCRELLSAHPDILWLEPVRGDGRAGQDPSPGAERDFRNKAKLVIGGTVEAPTLGILDPDRRGVDLRDCGIQSPGIRAVIPVIGEFLTLTGLAPYDVPTKRGEVKFVHVTEAPSRELMLRFVVRSQLAVRRIRELLADLVRLVPLATVVSVNLLPEHRAVLEGEHEELLLGESLDMDLGEVSLHLRPQSFFQTNTAVARALYAQASAWVGAAQPASLWDLYCGVGGFALHCARAAGGSADRIVLGVETSEAAVESARRSAAEAGIDARFIAADATAFALGARARGEALPELLIVNPPRRGIGPELADWLDASGVPQVIYSSCNPESLAADLTRMPQYAVREARLFDMFPHTRHLEVAVRLERR
ncbi:MULTISPECIES: methyltransferase domain-containing protein [unclassified Leucobacter]|uniref:methyltransferase domain-containing protein n=1 Tax=unclassified Leucobacter TaxID=2621730 RepID=UPI00165E88E6|nr:MULTISPECIES: methyltransferase domain-containing protein [unclassified Leucobacter]MBC9928003.1 methyltransferase domain-containing protein [Leucobacter sp. cx-169]